MNKFIEYEACDILLSRENRVESQNQLINKFKKTLVVVRVNYPGVIKNNQTTLGIIKEMDKIIPVNISGIIFNQFQITAEGPILTYVIDKDAMNVKKDMVEIEENHALGRLVDIDVYNSNHVAISRRELGVTSRSCFLCLKEAHACVRNKTHSEEELKKFIEKKYLLFITICI